MLSIAGGILLNLVSKSNTLFRIFILFIFSLVAAAIYYSFPSTCIFYSNEEEVQLKNEIEKIYNTRDAAFISGNLNSLKPLFDSSQQYGKWSLEHEIRRVKYLKSWSKQREVKFINVESFVRVKRIYNKGSKIIVSLEESYKFDYLYPKDLTQTVNSFGVGIRHTLTLIKKNDLNKIYSDWYTDCFEDAMGSYSGDIGDGVVTTNYEKTLSVYKTEVKAAKPYYNREKAVDYADKYCGAAWGSDNNYKYNKKYNDYNGIGGDCTNFASQVLGDSEGGGLPQDGSWYCSSTKNMRCPGTRAWVNVNGLKDYLLYSGKGSQIKKGTFKELTTPTSNYSQGVISRLKPGDLICYEKKGDPDHFAIVTSIDSHGYPLVNSHTTDRYHVPWDLGWSDNRIKFILIHING